MNPARHDSFEFLRDFDSYYNYSVSVITTIGRAIRATRDAYYTLTLRNQRDCLRGSHGNHSTHFYCYIIDLFKQVKDKSAGSLYCKGYN